MSSIVETSAKKYTIQCSESTWDINHVTGNLFSCPADEALAHCISEDCRMGAGIAVKFKKEFGGVDDLKKQKKLVGQCAVLKRSRRFVFYLITKKKYHQKPTYESLKQSLEDMKSHCVLNGITRISMPRIGCGLDKLQWKRVSEILKEVFGHTDIFITVYSLPNKAKTTVMKEITRRFVLASVEKDEDLGVQKGTTYTKEFLT